MIEVQGYLAHKKTPTPLLCSVDGHFRRARFTKKNTLNPSPLQGYPAHEKHPPFPQ